MVINEIENEVERICKEYSISRDKITIKERGNPHKIENLSKDSMGIYIFANKGEVLKVGKVGGYKSNSRFTSQHYNPNSASSCLAKSLLNDVEFNKKVNLNESNINRWMKDNLQRIDIIISRDIEIKGLNLMESIMQYKLNPKYEGWRSQRKKQQ